MRIADCRPKTKPELRAWASAVMWRPRHRVSSAASGPTVCINPPRQRRTGDLRHASALLDVRPPSPTLIR
jgi:hypothetical protein